MDVIQTSINASERVILAQRAVHQGHHATIRAVNQGTNAIKYTEFMSQDEDGFIKGKRKWTQEEDEMVTFPILVFVCLRRERGMLTLSIFYVSWARKMY